MVHLQLSRDGLVGTGKELKRLAHKFQGGSYYHLMPANSTSIIESLVIVLTGDSCDTIFGCKEFEGTIHNYVK
jgi:hypothetical protein